MELSYIDLIHKLVEDVKSDAIPQDDKEEILETLGSLYDLLWPYSN